MGSDGNLLVEQVARPDRDGPRRSASTQPADSQPPLGKQETVARWASRKDITRLTWYSLLVLSQDQYGINAPKTIEIWIGGRRASASHALAMPAPRIS